MMTPVNRIRLSGIYGFSILEMTITLVIFSFIVVIAFQFFNVSNQNMNDSEVRIQFKEQADRIVDRIFNELKQAGRPTTQIIENLVPTTTLSGFYIPPDALQRVDGKTYGIGFQIPTGTGTTGTVLNTSSQINYGTKVIYYLNTSNRLVRAEVSGTTVVSSQNVGHRVSFFEVKGDASAMPTYVDIAVNFQGQSLSRRMLFQGQDPTAGSLRGDGTKVSLRNIPTSPDNGSTEGSFDATTTVYGACVLQDSYSSCGY